MLGLSTWILLVQPLPRNIEKEATQVTKQKRSGPLEKKKKKKKKSNTEVEQTNSNTKRFQVTFRDENTHSGMAGANV